MRIKRGVVCKVPGWEPCGLLTNVTLPLFITSHPGPYTANWMVISFNFKRYRYKNAHNGQEITESHKGMAWTGENGQSGSTMQYPGDALRPEFGTQNGSGPRLLLGEHESQDCSGLFAAGWAIEGHAPKVCFFLCKMGLQSVNLRVVFIFITLSGVATFFTSQW